MPSESFDIRPLNKTLEHGIRISKYEGHILTILQENNHGVEANALYQACVQKIRSENGGVSPKDTDLFKQAIGNMADRETITVRRNIVSLEPAFRKDGYLR